VVGSNDLYTYDAGVSGAGSPTATQSPSGTYVAVAVLLRATVITTPVVANYSWNSLYQLCNIYTGTRTFCLASGSPGPLTSPWYTNVPTNGSTYQYDGQGLRIGTESGVTVGSTTNTTTTDSTWDTVSGGNIPLNINDAVTTSANPGTTTNKSYIYGPLLYGGTAPIEQITGTTASFIVSNPTGVQAVFNSSGTLLEKAIYSTYGVQTIQSGSDVTPFGFQGSYTDPTGFIYLINRYYDPLTDQFMSVDPLVAVTDQPYVFTNDNPLNAEDPLGLQAIPFEAGGPSEEEEPGSGGGTGSGNGDETKTEESKSNAQKLSKGAQKFVKGIMNLLDKTVRDAIKIRGGGASQLNQLETGTGDETVRNVAEKAAKGDRNAIRALKMIKGSGTQGKGGK
jgi:RHS repeat-associated protein